MKSFETSSPIEKIEDYYALLGCIKYNEEYNFYLMPIAWWILDYEKYDPKYSKNDDFNFRNNIYILKNNNKNLFIESIEHDKISLDGLKEIVPYYNDIKYEFDNYTKLMFYIDFDSNNYTYSFYDIELENYLPEDWTG